MLQSKAQNLSEASGLAVALIDDLQDMRESDYTFERIWSDISKLIAENFAHFGQARPKRRSKPPQMEEYHVLEPTSEREHLFSKEHFRRNFMFPVLDRMLTEMNRRFSQNKCGIIKGIDALNPKSKNFLSPEHLKSMQEKYFENDEDLQHEIYQVKRLMERRKRSIEEIP